MIRLEFYKGYSWAAAKLGGMCSPEYAIFTIIYSYHEAKRDCFYSLSSFAKMIGCGRSTVQRALKRLKDTGVLLVGECNYTNSLQYDICEKVVAQWIEEWKNASEKNI
ncbi:helix-turn-helix domain-containing protein [Ruminococcus sp.]|uniref:helix-turn-helix domain-containing protein n=1 Tax=Ruminococcus sp. TaxID=41978 RepID=UPI003454C407